MKEPSRTPAPRGAGVPSRRAVLGYAASAAVLASLPVTAGPRASAAGKKLIDFADRLVPVDDIVAAGYAGAVVFVAESRPGANFDFKPVRRTYADALRARGLQVVSNYQYGKPGWSTPSDFTRGFDGGVADARTAATLHTAAGGPDRAPIFFSVDEDIDAATWKTLALPWFRGINTVLGVPRTGVYGSAQVCGWAIADDVVGRSGTAGFSWAWQTKAWSRGRREAAAVLYQSAVYTASNPAAVIGGIHVDEDDVLAGDFGQWDVDRRP